MQDYIIKHLLRILFKCFTKETMREAIEAILDIAREAIKRSETKMDDKIIEPIIDLIEDALNLSEDE